MEYIEGKEPYKRQNIPYHSQRPPIRECSEAQFMRDYCAFCSSQMGRRVTPDSWPDTVLNGIRLDVYNLYREVVQRGGFGCVPLMHFHQLEGFRVQGRGAVPKTPAFRL